ncbi:MFS transporter [Kitasatospora sp. NPDC001159]
MLVVMVGVLIAAIDSTIVVLALPEIQHDLDISLTSATWAVVTYLLVVTVLATQVGRLGDMYGRVRMYEAGFVVFTIGSVLCALAWNAPAVIGFRVVQGLGAALIAAKSGAVISELYPPQERGRAYGLNALVFSLGSVLGVLLGGVIVTYVSSRRTPRRSAPWPVAWRCSGCSRSSNCGTRNRPWTCRCSGSPR